MSFLKTALECVKQCKPIILEGFYKEKEIELKNGKEIDLVTTIDKAVEKKTIEVILGLHSNHSIMSEESDDIEQNKEYRWIVDPIDGTTNFVHNVPHFAISIALEYQGELVLGTVYNPITNELFTAEKDNGAFLNGLPIYVSKTKILSKSLLATGFPYDSQENAELYAEELKPFLRNSRGLRRAGAASLDICYVACGRYDGYWERNLKPWDYAGGSIILTEAGGKVSDFSNKGFKLGQNTYLSSNGHIHSEMSEILIN